MRERMSNERAIEILKNDCCYECSWGCRNPIECNNKECDYRQSIIIAIESLEQDKETKEKMWAKQLNECEECEVINNDWVDVRDRLPSEDGDYLVQLQIDARGKEIYFLQVSFYTYDNGTTEWLYNGFYNAFKNVDPFVIAWRPLPKPYERKERE